MISFVDDFRRYFAGRKRAYARKLRWIALFLAAAIIVMTALAIALSEIIPMLLLFISIAGLVVWYLVSSGRIEIAAIISYIRDLLHKLKTLLGEKEDELQKFEGDPADFSLLQLLSLANMEERAELELFAGKTFKNAEKFEIIVREKATHGIPSFIKRVRGVEKEHSIVSYGKMLDLTGEQFKIDREGRKDRDFEVHLVRTAFEKMVDSMNEKDRKLLEHEISTYAEEHLGASNLNIALTGGGLLAANLGGFATYTMASSLLAGVSSLFGVGLPFAAYTALTSVLSVALGPVGIIAIGSWGLHKITSPDIKATILIVLSVASIRERLIYEFPENRKKLEKEINDYTQQLLELESTISVVESSSGVKATFAAISNNTIFETIEHMPDTGK